MKWRRSNSVALGVLSILALIFILFAIIAHYLMKWELAYGLSCNIAATCMTFVLLAWIYSITGGEPLQQEITELRQVHPLIEAGIRNGLLDAFLERPTDLWNKVLVDDFLYSNDSFPENVDVIGIALKRVLELLRHDRERWVCKVAKGCNMRILVLDPDGSSIDLRLQHEGIQNTNKNSRPQIGNSIRWILESIDHEEVKGSFKFGIYNTTPYCHILRIGRKMLVTNYLYGEKGYYWPTVLLQEAADDHSIFGKYMEHFDNIWNSGEVKFYELKDGKIMLDGEIVLDKDSDGVSTGI